MQHWYQKVLGENADSLVKPVVGRDGSYKLTRWIFYCCDMHSMFNATVLTPMMNDVNKAKRARTIVKDSIKREHASSHAIDPSTGSLLKDADLIEGFQVKLAVAHAQAKLELGVLLIFTKTPVASTEFMAWTDPLSPTSYELPTDGLHADGAGFLLDHASPRTSVFKVVTSQPKRRRVCDTPDGNSGAAPPVLAVVPYTIIAKHKDMQTLSVAPRCSDSDSAVHAPTHEDFLQ